MNFLVKHLWLWLQTLAHVDFLEVNQMNAHVLHKRLLGTEDE